MTLLGFVAYCARWSAYLQRAAHHHPGACAGRRRPTNSAAGEYDDSPWPDVKPHRRDSATWRKAFEQMRIRVAEKQAGDPAPRVLGQLDQIAQPASVQVTPCTPPSRKATPKQLSAGAAAPTMAVVMLEPRSLQARQRRARLSASATCFSVRVGRAPEPADRARRRPGGPHRAVTNSPCCFTTPTSELAQIGSASHRDGIRRPR